MIPSTHHALRWINLLVVLAPILPSSSLAAAPRTHPPINSHTQKNSNPNPQIVGFDRLDTTVSYFIGNDPSNWHTHVPVWGGVRYVDVYPGIDLQITSVGGKWHWRPVARTPGTTER